MLTPNTKKLPACSVLEFISGSSAVPCAGPVAFRTRLAAGVAFSDYLSFEQILKKPKTIPSGIDLGFPGPLERPAKDPTHCMSKFMKLQYRPVAELRRHKAQPGGNMQNGSIVMPGPGSGLPRLLNLGDAALAVIFPVGTGEMSFFQLIQRLYQSILLAHHSCAHVVFPGIQKGANSGPDAT